MVAAGNDNASVMGGGYPGGGITLGPAMPFGFIAAEFVAAQPARPADAARTEAEALSRC